jgi:PIN domain nuclease of toxin-antitoxin system
VRVLLDTHVLIWWAADDPRLSRRARRILGDRGNELWFSAAGAWELLIKNQAGKLTLPEPAATYVPSRLSWYGVEPLPVEMRHVLGVAELPRHHRDPFDRLLIAQSRLENLPIVTSDGHIKRYQVETIW